MVEVADYAITRIIATDWVFFLELKWLIEDPVSRDTVTWLRRLQLGGQITDHALHWKNSRWFRFVEAVLSFIALKELFLLNSKRV